MMTRLLFLPVLVAFAAGTAAAQGLVIPNEPDLPPLALTRHEVRVEIDHQAAVTTVEQVFLNHTERQLEAQYVFPVPKGAAMTRFTMLMNGKETAGEMVEKTKAREIYNAIVNRARDPGLLEYLGSDVFRANIFPIAPHGSQTITVRFEQVLPADGSLVRYLYPVRHGTKRGPTVQGEFKIDVSIRSAAPILNLYSPSHAVQVTRANDREAKVSFSEKKVATLDRDFQLYYGVSDKDIGFNLVTFRPDAKEPGYFMMLVSPRSKLQSERIVRRDLVFVCDTSGSMAGEKIEQAKNAMKYCIRNLNEGDRFNIVRFSTEAQIWKAGQMASAAEDKEAALNFVDKFVAAGGTDIAGALDAALALPRDPARPFFIVYMTDGKPTMGETTDPKQILNKVEKYRAAMASGSMRLFTWGVGYDVDTQLLDGMAEIAGGVSEYVKPEEDIASKVAAFYGKASHPVLTQIEFTLHGDKVLVSDLHPRAPSDLYAGAQLVLFGRYTGDGDVACSITGHVNEKTETFTFEGKFPASLSQNKFIEPLWARRRIGHLLDAIRLHGETDEVKNEVIRLSIAYGVQTPYTSYLILEDGSVASADPRRQEGGRHGFLPAGGGWRGDNGAPGAPPSPDAEKHERETTSALDALASKSRPAKSDPAESGKYSEEADEERKKQNELAEGLARGFKDKDGKLAVETAGYLRILKEADRDQGSGNAAFKKAGEIRFFLYRGLWVDERFAADLQMTSVKFGSAAYFRIVELHPEILEALQVSTDLILLTAQGKALVVSTTGEETLTDEQITDLFTAVSK